VLASLIPLLFLLQGALAREPTVEGVRAERELRPETPLPGEPIEVTLTVENVGDTTIPDLRFVDGVPAELGVADGTPRGAGPLRPGETLSTTYILTANRGAYAFDDVVVRARNVSGARMMDTTVRASGANAFESLVSIEDIPINEETTPYSGPLATDSGGPGLEFHATREYQAGDPVRRINWNRYAKTGELSTIEYREQRAANVTVVIDSREPAHAAARSSLPTGATLCAYAATLAVEVLSDMGHQVSVAALGTADPVTGARTPAWASVEENASFAPRAAAICNESATGSDETTTTGTATLTADGGRRDRPTAPDRFGSDDTGIPAREQERLRAHIPTGAQVLLCTPALDDGIVDLVETLVAENHEMTVLSPQVTADSVGGRAAALERATRLHRLRVLGGTVVDWDRNERLPSVLSRTVTTGVR
jgi:uncharacterized protein (DUF58 family)